MTFLKGFALACLEVGSYLAYDSLAPDSPFRLYAKIGFIVSALLLGASYVKPVLLWDSRSIGTYYGAAFNVGVGAFFYAIAHDVHGMLPELMPGMLVFAYLLISLIRIARKQFG